MAVTTWGLGLGGVAALPIALLAGPGGAADATAETWLAMLYLAMGSTFLAFVAWYWALRTGGIGRVGTFQFTQPAIGVAAALLLGEAMMVPLIGAAVVVLAGVWLAVAVPTRGGGAQRGPCSPGTALK
jgi:drug/metabolite transporter (DMT)-like permease